MQPETYLSFQNPSFESVFPFHKTQDDSTTTIIERGSRAPANINPVNNGPSQKAQTTTEASSSSSIDTDGCGEAGEPHARFMVWSDSSSNDESSSSSGWAAAPASLQDLGKERKENHDPNSVWHFRPLKRASTQDPSLLACSCVGLGSKFKTTTHALIKGLSHANINEFQAPLSVTVRSF